MNAPATAKELAPAETPTPQIRVLGLDVIKPSSTNRRKFDEASLKELGANIKQHGILQPILVRSITVAGKASTYEIVAGERRWRAAKLAGLTGLPCIVREMSDQDALLVQVIENNQRENVHPLEEAEGYQRLMAEPHNFTADRLAEKIGRSRRYVFQRLKLLSLTEPLREKFYDGGLDLSLAYLVARIPASQQAKAVSEITNVGAWVSPEGGGMQLRASTTMTVRAATEYLQKNYMLALDKAPFDIKVTDYFGTDKAGKPSLQPLPACTQCPKRTGANPDLFDDVKAPDMCTDAACYDEKRAAAVTRRIEEARAQGKTVIDGKQAEKIRDKYGNLTGGYKQLDDYVNAGDAGMKTVKSLLGKNPDTVLVADPRQDGKLIEVVTPAALAKALEAKGVKPQSGSAGAKSDADKKAEQRAQEARELELAVRMAVYKALFEEVKKDAAAGKGLSFIEDVRLITAEVAEWMSMTDGEDSIAQLYGYSAEKFIDWEGHVKGLRTAADMLPFILMAALMRWVDFTPPKDKDNLMHAANRYAIDVPAIKSRIVAERKAAAEKVKDETPVAGVKAAKK